MIFEVRVSEVGFLDSYVNHHESEKKKVSVLSASSSSSSSSSEFSQSKKPGGVEDDSIHVRDEALNAVLIGNCFSDSKDMIQSGTKRSLGECDLVGNNSKENARENGITFEKNLEVVGNEENFNSKDNWVEILFKNPRKGNGPCTEKMEAEKGVCELGLESNNISFGKVETSLPKRLSLGPELNNPNSIQSGALSEAEVEDWVSSSDFEENFSNAERVFSPELESKRITNKRYGSLLFLQDKVISEEEKKQRDRAIRREKKKSKGWDSSELLGRSLSNFDLIQRWGILTKKARKALALGKSLDFQI
ncbi:hypothetical protein GQ457_07G007820 [Hibiscus cannabinus]